jgi:chromosome segregation ATPase
LQKELDALSAQSQQTQQEAKQLKEQNDEIAQQLHQEKGHMSEELAASRSEAEQLRALIAKMQARINELLEMEGFKEELIVVQKVLDDTNIRCAAAERRWHELESDIKGLQEKVVQSAHVQKALEVSEQGAHWLRGELSERFATMEGLKRELGAGQGEIAHLLSEVAAARDLAEQRAHVVTILQGEAKTVAADQRRLHECERDRKAKLQQGEAVRAQLVQEIKRLMVCCPFSPTGC